MVCVGNSGHVVTCDWQTGTIHAQLLLQETCRAITHANSDAQCPPGSYKTNPFSQLLRKKYVFEMNLGE